MAVKCCGLCVEDVCSDEAALSGLRDAALQVARSLDDLMNHIRRGTTSTYEGTQVLCSSVLAYQFLRFSADYVQKVIYVIISTLDCCLPSIFIQSFPRLGQRQTSRDAGTCRCCHQTKSIIILRGNFYSRYKYFVYLFLVET